MPSRDVGVTMNCVICGNPFTSVGRQRWCSHACRQAAYRRRHAPPSLPSLPPPTHRRHTSIYECTSCGTRQLGEQRCADCGLFGTRIGAGGSCPHCEEPVVVEELLEGH